MVRSLALLVCAGVLHACVISTRVEDTTFVCGSDDDCSTGHVCYEQLCITREEFFARQVDGGSDAGSDGGIIEYTPPDSGSADSGADDGGVSDSGVVDSGVRDAGTMDSGVPDGGALDGGCDAGLGLEVCGDGIDNNCNQQIDCAETACATMACGANGRVCTGLMCTCAGGGTPEATELTCGDSRDNDCDGQTDCSDSTCAGRACGANGRTCSGTSCTCSGNGGVAQATETTCSDTRDNDCDGLVDCADMQCAGQACGANGRTCSGTNCTCSGNGGAAQANETTCNDTRDNDCDGLADCADTQCAGQACGANGRTCSGASCACSGNGGMAQATETSCSDGFDNDCDGLVDGADPSCGATPLDGGYTMTTPTIAFVDACAQAGFTRHMFADADDDVTAVMNLPFSFTFYGVPRTQWWISTNGLIGLNASTNAMNDSLMCLPTDLVPRPAIYADYDDLITRNGVCSAVTGSAPNRQLVVTWPDMDHYEFPMANVHVTLSAILYETTNVIEVVYSTMSSTDPNALGGGGIVGLQNGTGTRYNEFECHTAGSLSTGLSIRFTPN